MKKRKSPIFLVTLLFVCTAFVIGMNWRPSKDTDHDAPPPAADAKPGAPRTGTPSVSDLQAKNKAALQGKMTPPKPGGRGMPPGMPPEAMPPSIENPAANAKRYKPTPNDSSISTQWYTDEAKK